MGRFAALTGLVGALVAVAVALPSAAGPGRPGFAEPDGLLVLGAVGSRDRDGAVTGELAMVANPRTGATRVQRLPGGTLCGGSVLAGGDGVVFSGHDGRRAIARTLPLDMGGRPRSLGRADVMAPVGSTGRLLMARARYGARLTVLRALREVGPEGSRPVRARLLLPGWTQLEGSVDGALLASHGRSLTLWDPTGERPRRSIRNAQLLAAGTRRLAWCQGHCVALTVWSPDGERRLRPPPGTRPERWIRGALSPDDRRLAIALRSRAGVQAAVVDLARGAWATIPGGRLRGYRSMAWSPSGEWLYFTGGDRRLMGWQAGAKRAVRLPIHPRGTVMSLATAEAPG